MLEARNLGFYYGPRRPEDGGGSWLFRNLSLALSPGEFVGLPGPSGRGKTTLARILCGYLRPREGLVLVNGAPIPDRGAHPVQMLFQHPELAVNPRFTGAQIVGEAFAPSAELLEALCVEPAWLSRHPHELSGGELQRLCLARALGPATRHLVADEISSMLDAATQARIWRTIRDQAERRGLGVLVISHDPVLLDRLCARQLPDLAARGVASTRFPAADREKNLDMPP